METGQESKKKFFRAAKGITHALSAGILQGLLPLITAHLEIREQLYHEKLINCSI